MTSYYHTLLLSLLYDDELAESIIECCGHKGEYPTGSHSSHDTRWCATCKIRRAAIEEYREELKMNSD